MVTKSADAFRTISEVAEWLGVQTHVLRFWESKFTQVKPVKRAGGRRYYRPSDMLLLGGIRKLLHDDGMTIKGVQKILREEGMAHVADMSPPLDDETVGQVDGDLVASDTKAEEEMSSPLAELTETENAASDTLGRVVVSLSPKLAEDSKPTDIVEPATDAAIDDAPEAPKPVSASDDRDPETPDLFASDDTAAAATTDVPAEEYIEETASEEAVEQAAEDDDAAFAPVPGFMRSPSRMSEPENADADPASEKTALPSFMRPPSSDDPAPAAKASKPDIIDVPEEPALTTWPAAPSALSLSLRTSSLSPTQRDAIAPLVEQLTAVRDRMTQTRSDSR